MGRRRRRRGEGLRGFNYCGLPKGLVQFGGRYHVDSELATSVVSLEKFQAGTNQQELVDEFYGGLGVGVER